jgi:HSP20 family protein
MAKQTKSETLDVQKPASPNQASMISRVMNPYDGVERRFEKLFRQSQVRPFPMDHGVWNEIMLTFPLSSRCPSIDLVDRENDVVARVEVPGFARKDLEVSVSGNLLTVKGHIEREEKDEKEQYFRSEITTGSFSRSVLLPLNVDAGKVSASLKDGILEVSMPKTEASRRRNIKVQ